MQFLVGLVGLVGSDHKSGTHILFFSPFVYPFPPFYPIFTLFVGRLLQGRTPPGGVEVGSKWG